MGTRYKDAAGEARVVWFRMSYRSMVAVYVAVASSLWLVCGASGATVPEAKDSWVAMVHCLDNNGAAACVQRRAVRALEDLLPQDDEKDVELPKGISPSIAKVIDRLGEMISSSVSQWYLEDDAQDPNNLDQARGKKKKIHKAMKKLIIRGLILLYVKQQAITLFLYSVQTFVLFKFMVFAGIFVLTNVVKVVSLLSWHHHEKHASKSIYIEPQIKHVTQHHAHVGPPSVDDHHEIYAPEGYDYEPAEDHEPIWARTNDHAQRLAYVKQAPPTQIH